MEIIILIIIILIISMLIFNLHSSPGVVSHHPNFTSEETVLHCSLAQGHPGSRWQRGDANPGSLAQSPCSEPRHCIISHGTSVCQAKPPQCLEGRDPALIPHTPDRAGAETGLGRTRTVRSRSLRHLLQKDWRNSGGKKQLLCVFQTYYTLNSSGTQPSIH